MWHNIQELRNMPTECTYGYHIILRIICIKVYNNNWLIFVMEMQCLLYVETKILYII
jgi:hypothetical protein